MDGILCLDAVPVVLLVQVRDFNLRYSAFVAVEFARVVLLPLSCHTLSVHTTNASPRSEPGLVPFVLHLKSCCERTSRGPAQFDCHVLGGSIPSIPGTSPETSGRRTFTTCNPLLLARFSNLVAQQRTWWRFHRRLVVLLVTLLFCLCPPLLSNFPVARCYPGLDPRSLACASTCPRKLVHVLPISSHVIYLAYSSSFAHLA